ncbi:MAG: hypothetical protein K9J30_06695 [Bacteroidales bacterium]|nr:hypothetical protein [Bacteroidales bacterium]
MESTAKSSQHSDKESEKKTISILRSGNSSAIITTINEIRDHGKIIFLPEIFDLLLNADDNEILGACIDLINDLKQNESVPYVIRAIKDSSLKDIRHHLVSSCWQSGLNYAKYTGLFTDLLIREEYLVAVEALTVIENHLSELTDEETARLLARLQDAVPRATEHKKALINELINTVKNF